MKKQDKLALSIKRIFNPSLYTNLLVPNNTNENERKLPNPFSISCHSLLQRYVLFKGIYLWYNVMMLLSFQFDIDSFNRG